MANSPVALNRRRLALCAIEPPTQLLSTTPANDDAVLYDHHQSKDAASSSSGGASSLTDWGMSALYTTVATVKPLAITLFHGVASRVSNYLSPSGSNSAATAPAAPTAASAASATAPMSASASVSSVAVAAGAGAGGASSSASSLPPSNSSGNVVAMLPRQDAAAQVGVGSASGAVLPTGFVDRSVPGTVI